MTTKNSTLTARAKKREQLIDSANEKQLQQDVDDLKKLVRRLGRQNSMMEQQIRSLRNTVGNQTQQIRQLQMRKSGG